MKISTILDHIDSGHMALPEFQRGYVWNRDQVRGLFDSLYRRHPVGGLLVWATEAKTAAHLGDGPLVAGIVKLLLDGQQRATSIALGFYTLVFKNPLGDPLFYILSVLLGSISFASVFTMISGIASKSGNGGALMAILSFPVVIPLLVVLIKLSKNAMDGLDRSVSIDEIAVLIAINVIVLTTSLLLFPFLWRE